MQTSTTSSDKNQSLSNSRRTPILHTLLFKLWLVKEFFRLRRQRFNFSYEVTLYFPSGLEPMKFRAQSYVYPVGWKTLWLLLRNFSYQSSSHASQETTSSQ